MGPRPHLSITLPRSFQFHYVDNELPKTPAPPAEQEEEIIEPPPPPKQTFKVRRRNRVEHAREHPFETDSGILPTIEMTEASDGSSPPAEADSAMTPGYLAPRAPILHLLSPPKTPVSQTHTYDASKEDDEWSLISGSRDVIARPLSACSSFSDSSTSSFGSSNHSHDSMGGSCTSPESEAADPFSYSVSKMNQPIFSPDLASDIADSPVIKRAKTHRSTKWTPEMDEHLWLTYMWYIQDPRVTPFKMLPGTAPPLGVCHRVAREAKHSWKRNRTSSPKLEGPRVMVTRAGSPDTIRPDVVMRSGTPTATDGARTSAKWPRSEAATRRRLRDLCKRKPSLSAHYQRLLKTRSPSPFQSSSSSPKSRSDEHATATSSRSLNVSLAAATAPSLPSEAPQAQLDSTTPAQAQPSRPDGWFNRVGRSQAHQKSQSLQLGLGLGYGYTFSSQTERPKVLASPFAGDMGREQLFASANATQSLGRHFGRKSEGEPTLHSPVELHAPVPTARSLKRRFKLDDDIPSSHNNLQNLFDAPPVETPARLSRDRAFSLGAVHDTTRSLSSFFPRGSVQDSPMPDVPSSNNYLQASETGLRLGSPFGGSSVGPHFNTFPRRFTPLGTEIPTSSPFMPNQSLEGRFRELAGQRQR